MVELWGNLLTDTLPAPRAVRKDPAPLAALQTVAPDESISALSLVGYDDSSDSEGSHESPQQQQQQLLLATGDIQEPEQSESDERPLLDWQELVHEVTGESYYWNRITQQTTWDAPPRYTDIDGNATDATASPSAHSLQPFPTHQRADDAHVQSSLGNLAKELSKLEARGPSDKDAQGTSKRHGLARARLLSPHRVLPLSCSPRSSRVNLAQSAQSC